MEGRVELETVLYEAVADGVVLVTLNRPEFGNGVVVELARDLLAAIEACEADIHTRVLVLTGAGKVFCAGADLHAFKRYIDERLRVEQEPFNARVLFPVTQRLQACLMPTIAAVNGGATAGGLDLSLACDIRIASTKAKMGETYIKLGLAPANGGTYFLPRLVGSGMAAELALTGDLVDAQRALEIGLVNRVVEPEALLAESIALAEKIASRPRRALEATKQALRASWHSDLAGTMAATYWATAALQYTDDLSEGINAAIEGRPPQYNRPIEH
ncbi:MAG TPA: enoyl-CoA hydratase/isomerase family protein [Solirubrobacteraceae bacterium]|jgi:enoyl-CoA hydratase|nr:enoyl-CoA hydratase/isomerase family protein [Solirubrobacteraceae bacterium]